MTIHINKGIDPTKFTFDFPIGTKVYDDFMQMGYTVGELDKKIFDPLDALVEEAKISREPDPPNVEVRLSTDSNNLSPMSHASGSGSNIQNAKPDVNLGSPDKERKRTLTTLAALVVLSFVFLGIAISRKYVSKKNARGK